MTWTGIVTGCNLFSVEVTEKPLSGADTATEHGVLQAGPSDVVASAPGGVDSSWTCTVGGVALKASHEKEEQPARPIPAAAITMTRRMVNPPLQSLSRKSWPSDLIRGACPGLDPGVGRRSFRKDQAQTRRERSHSPAASRHNPHGNHRCGGTTAQPCGT